MTSRGAVLAAVALAVAVPAWGGLQPPHDESNDVTCSDCHLPYAEPAPTQGDIETQCASCHNPTGQAWRFADVGMHQGIGCGKCHNPHRPEGNLSLIRTQYRHATANPGVVFRDRPGDFVRRGAPDYYGACENCHRNTDYYRRDGSQPRNHCKDHLDNDGSACQAAQDEACTACHRHGTGFLGDCMSCHSVAQGPRRPVVGADGDFLRTSHHVATDVQPSDCLVCHDLARHMSGTVRLKDVDTGDVLPASGGDVPEAFCASCHDADGAGGDLTPFSDGVTVPAASEYWAGSAHAVRGFALNGGTPLTCFGDGAVTGCHGNGHGSDAVKLLAGATGAAIDQFCFNCHTQGIVMNDALADNRPGGYTSADDIEQAFGKSRRHDLNAAFTMNGDGFTLQCTTCHNPHVVTGRYWDAEDGVSPVTRPDFSDPAANPRAMGAEPWGEAPGEKMRDFAAQGSGSGGWYYGKARGGVIAFDRPAVYQPPRSGDGWTQEFAGDVLPDYVTLCLDCHTYRMGTHPPVNWGQGIPCTGNSVDPPDQRVECGAQHGFGAANVPSYRTDPGLTGSGGNPDPIFGQSGVTRGRGSGHFMRWPYESASRFAGINFVMSCTDCHEAHGSNRGSMVRERLNVTGSGDCGTGGNPNPDGENCADGGNWNSFCGICHYYYGGQHAGMSCGNASCHEANSLHRIIHNTGSNATYLWSEPSRPTTTPEIESVEGAAGSDVLTVVFTRGVYAARGAAGALEPDDFLLTDAGGNNPRAIIAVDHVPGDPVAVLTMSAPLVQGDLFADFVATTGVSAWDAADNPAGPWPHSIPSGCPLGAVTFAFGEPAGSATVSDATRLLVGAVNDPAQSLPGDGAFHGDGVNNYAVFTNMTCLQADRALTLETRLRPNVVDDGTAATIRRVFARDSNQNYQMSVWRSEADTWLPTFHPPDGVAVIAFWASPVDKHGGLTWKVAQTDYDACPIVANHWYVVRLVWNSDKTGGIPADFFVDDQGTDGSGLGENWPGVRHCTDADQSQVPESNRMWEGDEIIPGDGNFAIGANVNNPANNVFDGLIDWIAWEAIADYPTAAGSRR